MFGRGDQTVCHQRLGDERCYPGVVDLCHVGGQVSRYNETFQIGKWGGRHIPWTSDGHGWQRRDGWGGISVGGGQERKGGKERKLVIHNSSCQE